jgi:hypothetical protein
MLGLCGWSVAALIAGQLLDVEGIRAEVLTRLQFAVYAAFRPPASRYE